MRLLWWFFVSYVQFSCTFSVTSDHQRNRHICWSQWGWSRFSGAWIHNTPPYWLSLTGSYIYTSYRIMGWGSPSCTSIHQWSLGERVPEHHLLVDKGPRGKALARPASRTIHNICTLLLLDHTDWSVTFCRGGEGDLGCCMCL